MMSRAWYRDCQDLQQCFGQYTLIIQWINDNSIIRCLSVWCHILFYLQPPSKLNINNTAEVGLGHYIIFLPLFFWKIESNSFRKWQDRNLRDQVKRPVRVPLTFINCLRINVLIGSLYIKFNSSSCNKNIYISVHWLWCWFCVDYFFIDRN